MPAPNAASLTLEGLSCYLLDNEALPLQARRDMCSAIRTFCRVVGRTPGELIADPAVVRSLKAHAPWQLARLSKARWANAVSNIGRAMKHAGIKVHRQRRNYAISPAWHELLAPLERRDREELRRFAGWCTVLGKSPTDVSVATFDDFLAYMEAHSLQSHPRERVHVARRAWNRAVARDGACFPVISAPQSSVKTAMGWSDFPASLQVHVAEWKARAVVANYLDEGRKAIKPITASGYSTRLRVMLSAAVASGIEPEHFTDLPKVIDPAIVRQTLNFLLDGKAPDDRQRQNLHPMVVAALNVARFLKVSAGHRAELAQLERKLRFVARGMNAKNKQRMRVLEHPDVRGALLCLPLRVARELRPVPQPTVRQAQRMQMAVLLEILLHVPMRIRNAAELDLAATIVRPIAGLSGNWRIAIPANEVKNEVAIDADLQAPSALLQLYVDRFRPVLVKATGTRLFIGQSGQPKTPAGLARQLAKFIQREVGIVIHAHLLRHFAARLFLIAHPGQYERVRQLLGHKSIDTTIKFYASFSSDAAMATYDKVVAKLRSTMRAGEAAAATLFEGDRL